MVTMDYEISDKELELFARILLPEIKKYFADEDIKAEFEQWKETQEKLQQKA